MTPLVIILIILGIWIVFLLVVGLIFEPRSIIKMALGPFWVLRLMVTRLNEFVEKSRDALKAFWDSHLELIQKASDTPKGATNATNTSNVQGQAQTWATPTLSTSGSGASSGQDARAPKNPDSSVAVWFVSRVLYLAIAAALIVTAGALDIDRATSAQFQDRVVPFLLPGLLGSSSFLNGVIWITMVMFWGIITLDVFELTPHYAQLIHIQGTWARRIFCVLIALGDVVLIFTLSAVFYTASINTRNVNNPLYEAGDIISFAQGILIGFAEFLALLAIISGAAVFVILGDGILLIAISILHIFTSVLQQLCDVIGDALARILGIHANAGRSVYTTLANRRILPKLGPSKFPRVSIDENGDLTDPLEDELNQPYPASFTPQSSRPTAASNGYATLAREGAPSRRYPESAPLVDVGRTIMLAVGLDAIKLMEDTLNDIATFDGDKLVNGVGYIGDWTSVGDPSYSFEIPIEGANNLSPGRSKVTQARRISTGRDEVRGLLIDDMFQNVLNYCQAGRPSRGQILFYLNLDSVPLITKEIDPRKQDRRNSNPRRKVNLIKQLHEDLPEYVIGVVAVARQVPIAVDELNEALKELREWSASGDIACTLLVDVQSPLVSFKGGSQQRRLVARSLASLICAPNTDSDNGSMGTVFNFMGRVAPFMACGVESRRIASGPQSAIGVFLNNFGVPRRGAGSSENIRTRVEQIFMGLLEERNGWTAAYGRLPGTDAHMISLVTIPMRATDSRWKSEEEQLTAILQAQSSAHMQPLYINGNGVPDNMKLPREYYAQVAVLAGIGDVNLDDNGALVGNGVYYRPVKA